MLDELFIPGCQFDTFTTVSNPGAGTDLGFAPGSRGLRSMLLAFVFTLTTDATVADRRVVLTFAHGTSVWLVAQAQVVQTASLAVTYFVSPGYVDSTVIRDSRVLMRLPYPLELLSSGATGATQGWSIASAVENLQAADAITGARYYTRAAQG